jgi:hypothetical protein
MADTTRRLRVACVALLMATATTACDTKAPYEPSLPPAAGFRVDNGVLKLWTGTPCAGVIRLTLTFDVGTATSKEQVWTAPQPGVQVERMDLLPVAGGPASDTDGPFKVEKPLPTEYTWTEAESMNFAVDGPDAFGARTDVGRVLRESAEHPPDSYLFGRSGWMNASDVQRENKKSFLTICTPDPN